MKLQKSFTFIKEKSGGAVSKVLLFCALSLILLNFFLKLQNYKLGKVKKFEHIVFIEKNVQSRTEEAVGL